MYAPLPGALPFVSIDISPSLFLTTLISSRLGFPSRQAMHMRTGTFFCNLLLLVIYVKIFFVILRQRAEKIVGVPEPIRYKDRVVGVVMYRDNTIIDVIRQIDEDA